MKETYFARVCIIGISLILSSLFFKNIDWQTSFCIAISGILFFCFVLAFENWFVKAYKIFNK